MFLASVVVVVVMMARVMVEVLVMQVNYGGDGHSAGDSDGRKGSTLIYCFSDPHDPEVW